MNLGCEGAREPSRERLKIERAYQRAMDIRDSNPTPENWNAIEERYRKAYMRAYKIGDVAGFRPETRRYLKAIRSGAANESY